MKNTNVKPESYEHLGTDMASTTVGDLILRSEEFGQRMDAQGEAGAQAALDVATDPQVNVDESVWGK